MTIRLLNRAAAIAAGIALTSCNLAPIYVRPASTVPPALPQGGTYPAAATDARDITKIGWRDFFVDERLRQVIQRGLDNNIDLRIAAANVLQAQAQYRVQRADLFPTIAASGSATHTNNALEAAGLPLAAGTADTGAVVNPVGAGNAVDVGFSSFEVDLFGRVRNLSKAAFERHLATEEAQRSLRISLIAEIAEIATAWLRLASDEYRLALSQQILDTFADTLKLTTAQFRIGVVSELESRQAEANYYAARNDVAELRTRIAHDRNALDLLVGGTVESKLLPTALGDTSPTLDALPTDLASTVLLQRPDVLQAEHQLIAQNANIGAARADFFPTISLTGALGTISPTLGGLFASGSGTYIGSPAISLPLFDGGRLQGNIDSTRVSLDAAVANYQKAIQVAFREVADALAQRGTIDERIAAQNARANAARAAAKLSEARYRAGY